MVLKVVPVVGKISPLVGIDYEIGEAVEISLVVGIGLFWETGPVVRPIFTGSWEDRYGVYLLIIER